MTVYGGGFSPPPPEPSPLDRHHGARAAAAPRSWSGPSPPLLVGAGTATAAVVLGNPTGCPVGAVRRLMAVPRRTDEIRRRPAAPRRPADGITLTATGDIIMGSAPSGLPPNGGKGFFDQVKGALVADLLMGNLEQTITEDTGVGKCSAQSAGSTCFAYRTPPAFVHNLKDAGFMLMNQANNHAYDFGPAGYKNTQKNLDSAGIKYTGWPGMITVAEVKGVKVAVVGFAPYPTWANSCTDLPKAQQLVTDGQGPGRPGRRPGAPGRRGLGPAARQARRRVLPRGEPVRPDRVRPRGHRRRGRPGRRARSARRARRWSSTRAA